MGRVVGTVVGGGVSTDPYKARMLGGGVVGSYPSAGTAQRAVDRSFGKRHLRWVRDDLPGGIERYVGSAPEYWPLDLGDRLSLWLDSDQGIDPTVLAGVDRVTTWHSWDRNGNQTATQAAADAPVRLAEAGPAAFDLVGFTPTHAESLACDLMVTPPYTLSVVASHEATAHGGSDILCSIGLERIEVSGGIWVWNTASGNIAGPAVVNGQLTVLTVVHSAAVGELFVNGVSAGTQADVIGASAASFSHAVSYWGGDLASAVIVGMALGAGERSVLVNYQLGRYGITP